MCKICLVYEVNHLGNRCKLAVVLGTKTDFALAILPNCVNIWKRVAVAEVNARKIYW